MVLMIDGLQVKGELRQAMKGKVRDDVIDQVVGDKNVNVESHCHFASNALLHRYSAACTRTSLVPTSSRSNRVLLLGVAACPSVSKMRLPPTRGTRSRRTSRTRARRLTERRLLPSTRT